MEGFTSACQYCYCQVVGRWGGPGKTRKKSSSEKTRDSPLQRRGRRAGFSALPRYPGFTRTTIHDIFIRRIKKKKSKKPKRVCRAETARRTILCCFVTVAVRDDKYRIAGNTATVARYLLERDARNIVHGPCARQNRGTGAVSGTVQRSSSSSRRASSRRHVYVAGRNAAPRATPFSRRPHGMTVRHPPLHPPIPTTRRHTAPAGGRLDRFSRPLAPRSSQGAAAPASVGRTCAPRDASSTAGRGASRPSDRVYTERSEKERTFFFPPDFHTFDVFSTPNSLVIP